MLTITTSYSVCKCFSWKGGLGDETPIRQVCFTMGFFEFELMDPPLAAWDLVDSLKSPAASGGSLGLLRMGEVIPLAVWMPTTPVKRCTEDSERVLPHDKIWTSAETVAGFKLPQMRCILNWCFYACPLCSRAVPPAVPGCMLIIDSATRATPSC